MKHYKYSMLNIKKFHQQLITIKVIMTITVEYLERNEIMSSFSPKVKQNDMSNCVMLELSPRVLNHARKVANKLNDKYYETGGKHPRGFIDLFGVLREMLDLQPETDETMGYDENEPDITTTFGKNLECAIEEKY